jgi:hypothetical protein
MNDTVYYQHQFFSYLTQLKTRERVLEGICTVLHIQKGAAYKRMSGDTALTTAELIRLAEYFQVSLDTIFQKEKYITFQHPFYHQKSTMDFLEQFTFFLKPLSSNNQSTLTYLANELPVFYYFSHKYIFNFLLSVWNHLHWTDTKLVIEENTGLTHQIEIIRAEITKYYSGHPVTEIWNSNMLANLYQQIIFSITIRAFKEEIYIRHLLEDIRVLITHLHELAHKGTNADAKQLGTERKIYLNDYGNYLNLLLYESDKYKSTFIGYDIPQFIVSNNPVFFDFSKEWIRRIRKRSVLISAEGYQNRELFFIKMERDFKDFENRVEKLVGIYYQEGL